MYGIRFKGKSVVVVFSFLLSLRAAAIPPPKTDEELFEMSDFVVDAECLSITCEGPPVADADKTVTTYRSKLSVQKTYKGEAVEQFEILGQKIVWNGREPTGIWHQWPISRGFVGKFYLKRLQDGTFEQVWWNGIQENRVSSHSEPWPSCGNLDRDARIPTDGGPASDGASGPAFSERGCGCRSGALPGPFSFLVVTLGVFLLVLRRIR